MALGAVAALVGGFVVGYLMAKESANVQQWEATVNSLRRQLADEQKHKAAIIGAWSKANDRLAELNESPVRLSQ